MSIESVMLSNHLILCHPLLFIPSIFPSIRVFSNEPAFHIRWPKYWDFSFSINPSNEYLRLISFRIYWFDLFSVKSLLQHHNKKTLTVKKAERPRIDAFELWCWRRLLRVPLSARRSNQSILKELTLNIHWKDWYWSWSSNTFTNWCEESTYLKRPWCLERLRAGTKGGGKGWDGCMASLSQWTWVWANSGR